MEDGGHYSTSSYDWAKEVEEFEATKTGVKGLVDSGVLKIPRFFIHPPETRPKAPPASTSSSDNNVQPQIPIIDLGGGGGAWRSEIVEQIRRASETWGFFQMVNHGVPDHVMEAMLEGTRLFHEQPGEAKMDLHSSDARQKVRFYTINGSFQESDVSNWRDVLSCSFQDDTLDLQAIPLLCRKEIGEYLKYMVGLRGMMSELLSEALGLSPDFLGNIGCMKSEYLACIYYPACPEPDLTFGTFNHTDPNFLTILVQDSMGGLQVLHQNHWVDVPPVPGALIVNIGDLMQLITNDKFKSVEHRVLAQSTGTRISVACFFHSSSGNMLKPYGPIKEITSENNPPLYKEVSPLEYVAHYQKTVRKLTSALPHFKL